MHARPPELFAAATWSLMIGRPPMAGCCQHCMSLPLICLLDREPVRGGRRRIVRDGHKPPLPQLQSVAVSCVELDHTVIHCTVCALLDSPGDGH